MRYLPQYVSFDYGRFVDGKELTAMTCEPDIEYKTKKDLGGSKLSVVITKDKTAYAPNKDGSPVGNNLFEKFNVRCAKRVTIPAGSVVELVNAVAIVFGDFRNQLSVRCDDVKVISGSQKG